MRLLCLVLGLLLLAPLAVFGGSFDTVVVFGDSLSDIGNIYVATKGESPPSEPTLVAPNTYAYYYQGRFSNGPVWAEYLTDEDRLDCQLVDMAYGGAETSGASPPGMLQQIGLYLETFPDLHKNALYVIWIGGNDFLGGATDPTPVVANIQTGMGMLAQAGIKNLLILNLPNLGKTPQLVGTPGEAGATAITQAFNALLASAVEGFIASNPGITVYQVDIYNFFEGIIADPASYGFTDASGSLLALKNPSDPDFSNSEGYVFWDYSVHPTTEAHEAIAEEAVAVLPASAVAPDDDDGDSSGGLCFIQTVFSAR
jgi:phospholipase/lecithinase/hemolysin